MSTTFNGPGAIAADNRKLTREFIWQPGGTRRANIYTDWANLYADFTAAGDGPRTISLDDSVTSPLPAIPAGTYQFNTADVLRGISDSGKVVFNYANGTTFINLREIHNISVTIPSSTATPISFTSLAVPFILKRVDLESSAALADSFISFGGASSYTLDAVDCSLGGGVGADPVLALVGTAAVSIILQGTNLQSGALEGDATANVVACTVDARSQVSTTHPQFAGGTAPLAAPTLDTFSERVQVDGSSMVHVSSSTNVEGALGELDGQIGPPAVRFAMPAEDINFNAGLVQTDTVDAAKTYTASNYKVGWVVHLILTNSGVTVEPTWPTTTTTIGSGTWLGDDLAVNHVYIECTNTVGPEFVITIAQ